MPDIFKKESRNITMTLRQSQKNYSDNLNFFECTFKLQKSSTAEDVIDILNKMRESITKKYPANKIFAESPDSSHDSSLALVKLQLTKQMYSLISNGTFIQKLQFISLVGLTTKMTSNIQFKQAVDHIQFQDSLQARGIENDMMFSSSFKRIHAVHPHYVRHDDEIGQGLLVTTHNHSNDNPIFVGNESALALAVEKCDAHSTLVIDGHWLHGKRSMHGVWDCVDAEEISSIITTLINKNPGKISKVILLGCESGMLRSDLEDAIEQDNLFVNSRLDSRSYLEVQNFRKKITYISENDGSIFAEGSLAKEILDKLEDKKISVRATPALGYPYPPGHPQINIASDAESWDSEHFWDEKDNTPLYNFCRQTKSVTQSFQQPKEPQYSKYKA